MGRRRVRYLPICDANNHLLNFVSLADSLLLALRRAGQEAFVVAVRRGLEDEVRWAAIKNAVRNGGDEYGYRRVVLSGPQGPTPFHLVEPEVALEVPCCCNYRLN